MPDIEVELDAKIVRWLVKNGVFVERNGKYALTAKGEKWFFSVL
jgi:predicted transcriptional regulator